ncbi:hypothetical protein [Streptomyces sp. NPDC023588]|uniref:hypothetical protein n=1 Tax=Streptomyces sp. NPDC023588 TaxID=3154907 RepID=UPI0033CD3670
MSTRRPLGTGPTTSTRSTAVSASTRLLPVERIEHEHQDVSVDEQEPRLLLRGRRALGMGSASAPEA